MTGRISSVRGFVEAMLKSRGRLEAPPSSTGSQLERASVLACGMDGKAFVADPGNVTVRDDSGLYRAAHVADEQYSRHAVYAIVWATLTAEEQAILELKHTPARYEPVVERKRIADVRDGDGLTMMQRIRDEDGELTDEATYMALEPQSLRNDEIAEVLFWRTPPMGSKGIDGKLYPFSESQVRTRVRTANAKIRKHALFLMLGEE